MQKFSRQIVQEEKLRLEPQLTSIVVRLQKKLGCRGRKKKKKKKKRIALEKENRENFRKTSA